MASIISIPYVFREAMPKGWGEFYLDLERKLVAELEKNKIEPKKVLYRGINFRDITRLLETGYDLPSTHNFYAGSIGDGQHSIRTALEYAISKRSSPRIFKKTKNQFAVSCYIKEYFKINRFVENNVYNNYNWALREGKTYKDALLIVFIFKPVESKKT